MASGRELWRRLVPDQCRCRMGPVSIWTLGLRSTVGLDLDRQCELGFHALSLWTLGLCTQRVGLGPWRLCGTPVLFARARRLVWNAGTQCKCRVWLGGLVSAWARGDFHPWLSLLAALHQLDQLRACDQHHQHYGHQSAPALPLSPA